MALGVMLTLTVAGTAAFTYTSSNARNAESSKASEIAYSLAEAGVANALSILHGALDPRTGSLLPPTTVTLPSGTVTYSGVLDANYVWTITSTGEVVNPTGPGGGVVQRTLTKKATIVGLMSGATVGAWNRIYHDNTSSCLSIPNGITIPASVSSRGDLCLQGESHITGATSRVSVGDDVTLAVGSSTSSVKNPSTASGSWTSPTNVYTNNTAYATYSVPGSGSSTDLDATGFGFVIPADATITGIRARVDRKAAASSRVSDLDVYLLKAGAPSGSDKAIGGTWGTTDAYQTYGSSTDLWGTTWTLADVNAGNFGLRFKVQANSGAAVTASVDHVELTVYYALPSSIGASGAEVEQADVAGTCQLSGGSANSPCSSVDKVYATTITVSPTDLSKPTVDFAYWYSSARPGPAQNCTTGSFTGGFDNNSSYDKSRSLASITPLSSSYTCEVWVSGNKVGELSWNHTTKVLKVSGTIFFDGPIQIGGASDESGPNHIVNYQGRGTIYASGTLNIKGIICAGGSGSTDCRTSMSSWDPTANMLVAIVGGKQVSGNDISTYLDDWDVAYQGVLYAVHDCNLVEEEDETVHLSGPILCDRVIINPTDTGQMFWSWPPLGSLLDGSVYGATATAPETQIEVGAQSG